MSYRKILAILTIAFFLASCKVASVDQQASKEEVPLNITVADLIDKSLNIQYENDGTTLTGVFTDEFIKSIPDNFYKKDLKPYEIVDTDFNEPKDASEDNFIAYVRVNDIKGDYIQVVHFIKRNGKYLIDEIEYDI